MVPRDHTSRGLGALRSAAAWGERAFAGWRALLGRLALVGKDAPGAALARYLSSPGAFIADAGPRESGVLLRVGLTALVVGLGVGSVVALSGDGPASAMLDVAGIAVWALVRLAVMRLLTPEADASSRARVSAAWAGSLVPFALAATGSLRLAAFTASVVLAYLGLAGALGRRRAFTLTCWAFGGQAAVSVAVWLARSGVMFAMWLGRS